LIGNANDQCARFLTDDGGYSKLDVGPGYNPNIDLLSHHGSDMSCRRRTHILPDRVACLGMQRFGSRGSGTRAEGMPSGSSVQIAILAGEWGHRASNPAKIFRRSTASQPTGQN